MKKLFLTFCLVTLCSGCTTIVRDSVGLDGTRTSYRIDSILNTTAITGLRFKDTGKEVELSVKEYQAKQDAALEVLLAALQAYLATMSAGK